MPTEETSSQGSPPVSPALRHLQDKSDINALIHRFVRGADNRNAEAMLSCVSDDGIISFNGGQLVLTGREELSAWLSVLFSEHGALRPGTYSTHMMANTLVTLDGDRASAETSGVTHTVRISQVIITRGVYYVDEFARIDGEWRLTHRRHRCDWQMEQAGTTDTAML